MKKLLALLLCLVTVFCLFACAAPATGGAETSSTAPTIDKTTPLCDGKTLKLLVISSSFGMNTTNYLYEIAKDQGCTEVIVARLFLAECTLRTHVANINGNAKAYTYQKRFSDEDWTVMQNVTMEYGILDEDWDIIFLQHSAEGAAQADTYKDYIPKMIQYIDSKKTNPKARYVWNMTWAFPGDSTSALFQSLGSDQMKHYETIVAATKEHVLPVEEFVTVIPSGTAVQNVRTSKIGDTLNRDSMHLNSLGYIIAGLATYGALTGKPIESVGISQFPASTYTSNYVITDEYKQIVIDSVNAALANPYQVTQSAFTE